MSETLHQAAEHQVVAAAGAPGDLLVDSLERSLLRRDRRSRRITLMIRLAQLLTVVALIAIWDGLSHSPSTKLLISSPSAVWDVLKNWASNGQRWSDLGQTMREAVLGYVIGSLIGVVLAFVLHFFTILRQLLSPILAALNALPKIALAPLFIVWFGLGATSKTYFVVAGIFFLSFWNISIGMRSIDRTVLDHVRVLGGNTWELLRQVYGPAVVGWTMTSLRISFSWALLSAVIAEYLGAYKGLGKVIGDGALLLEQDIVVAGIIVVAVVAVVADRILAAIERRFSKWRVA